MRSWLRYLLLLVGTTSIHAQQPAPARISCVVGAPDLPGGMTLGRVSLLFRRVDVREFRRVNFDQDGVGTATLTPGAKYRIEGLSMTVVAGRQTLAVERKFIAVEPIELWVPAAGPPPEPRIRVHLPRGPHHLNLKVASRTGRPISGARMLVVRTNDRSRVSIPYGIYESNVEGDARVAGLPVGHYRVTLIDGGPFAVAPERKRRQGRLLAVSRSDEVLVGGKEEKLAGFVLTEAGCLQAMVDTRGLREPPPVAVWSTFARLVAGPKVRPDADGPGAVYRFRSLPPGRYRVVATLPDGKTMLREVEVRAGAVTRVQLTRSRSRHRPFEFMARWENMPPDLGRTRWYLTALDSPAVPTSVFEAARGGGLHLSYGPRPEQGRYLVRYPAQGIARMLALDELHAWGIDLTPPKSGFLRRGHRKVRVQVVRGREPVTDLFVGLQERKRRGHESEKWMRYAASTKEGAVFREVPAGWYRVTFLDRVLGTNVGSTPRAREVSVWRDDVDLVVDLNE